MLVLPRAVAVELARVERRLGQVADLSARRSLAEMGEAAAVMALLTIAGYPREEVQSLTAFINWLAMHRALEVNAMRMGMQQQQEEEDTAQVNQQMSELNLSGGAQLLQNDGSDAAELDWCLL
ncbi:hypothetical protein ACP70R_030975 [Stipagrostis hirtigluma subsp. patula]